MICIFFLKLGLFQSVDFFFLLIFIDCSSVISLLQQEAWNSHHSTQLVLDSEKIKNTGRLASNLEGIEKLLLMCFCVEQSSCMHWK